MADEKARIAVFVSGGGTNLQALIDAERSGALHSGTIALVVSNKPDVYALERARASGIPAETAIKALGGYTPVLVCVLTAAVVGFAYISLCRLIIRKFGLKIFAFYTGALGLILIARQLLAG